MPPRVLSLDLSRTSYVCHSCLATLRGRGPNPQPWLIRHASNIARKPPPRIPPGSARAKGARATASIQDAERIIAQIQRGELPDEDDLDVDLPNLMPDQPLSVNYFQEKQSGRLQKLRDGAEFGAVSGGLDTEVETAINELEKQMVNTVQMLQQMEQEGMQDKAEELRKQFKKSLRLQYKGKIGPEAEEYGLLRIPGFSGPKHRPVANLNIFLARETVVKGGIPKHKDLVQCWKYYSAARKTLSSAWGNVPREVWDFLWMILSTEGMDNPNRMRHIYVLAKDMNAAGVTLRDSQQLLAIEAMFIEGWQEEAIEAWKKAVVTLGAKPETFKDYWELGIRMCSLHGDTDRAQRAADTLLRSAETPNARILIPVIRALSSKDATVEQAWESYRDMRELLGDTMTIEDYDEVIASFLATNRLEYALQAFVDMMFSGAIDVRGKTKLPLAVGNQFFLGKWLKRLIGAGDLDGAYKVVVYLQNKGITASPIQLNGLIGAWIRSGAAENLQMAEDLAWSMIRSRLRYVDMRQREASMDLRTRLYDPCGPAPVRDGRQGEPEFHCATRATAETFSVLAENYCSRGLHDNLRQLWDACQRSQVGTTSFLMNQLIRSHAQNGQADEAVDLYRTMTAPGQNVRPDAHTFLALFNTLSVNRLVRRDAELAERDIIHGRQFFNDMVQAQWTFDAIDIYQLLPRTILFSMLKAQDYPGMIVAARAMKELFDFTPQEPLLIELAAGTETLRVKTKRNVQRMMEANKLIEDLMKLNRRQLVEEGYDISDMSVDQKAAERRDVLEKLVLVKAKALDLRPEELGMHLEYAARDMGVYDIVMERDPERVAEHRKIAGRSTEGGED